MWIKFVSDLQIDFKTTFFRFFYASKIFLKVTLATFYFVKIKQSYFMTYYPYAKVTGSLSVCLYRGISLTAEPMMCLFFTLKLLLGLGKVYNYF